MGLYVGGTATANHLDDYEEGTWTPQSNSGSLNVVTAHYVKIGSSVTFQAYVGFPSQSGSAEQHITNFPFDIASSSDYHACAINSDAGISLTGQFISGGSLKFAKSSNTKATVSEMSSRFVIFSLTIVTH